MDGILLGSPAEVEIHLADPLPADPTTDRCQQLLSPARHWHIVGELRRRDAIASGAAEIDTNHRSPAPRQRQLTVAHNL